jgi:hypothetical protein
MRSAQSINAEVAYLRSSCDYLLARLNDVDGSAPTEDISASQEGMIDDAITRFAGSIRRCIEVATAEAEEWRHAIEDAVSMTQH